MYICYERPSWMILYISVMKDPPIYAIVPNCAGKGGGARAAEFIQFYIKCLFVLFVCFIFYQIIIRVTPGLPDEVHYCEKLT